MAVYTRITGDEFAELLTRYDIGRLAGFSGITQGVENSNYRLATTGAAASGDFILTIFEKRVAREDLPFFIGLMAHLATSGIPAPRPVADKNGAVLQEIKGKPAAIVTFLRGKSGRAPSPEQCRAGGEALARLHVAGKGYDGKRANALGVQGWRSLCESCAGDFDTVAKTRWNIGSWQDITNRLDEIIKHWPRDLPHGIIHADFFPDNVLFTGNAVTGVIDFYFACGDFLAYDIAITLNAWCFEDDGSFNITKARQLAAGYQSVRPLLEAERLAMPLLCRGAAMRFFLTRLYDLINTPEGAQVRPHDPLDYWKRLNFHYRVSRAEEYGFYT